MKTDILNVTFDVVTKDEALNTVMGFLKKEKNSMIFTPNPEMVMEANYDKDFMEILRSGDLIIPDGIGIVMASKLNKVKIKERVTGCDLIFSLFEEIKDKGYTVYILGSKKGVPELAKENMELKYKGLKIVGVADGYFDESKEKEIIKEIIELKPDILLVGLSTPKQEKWIYKYRNKLPVKLSMGVGGSIDIMAGTVQRCPVILQKLCLEWFYRVVKEPVRWKRALKIPVFVATVLKNKLL